MNRVPYVDLAKGLGIIYMVIVHTYEEGVYNGLQMVEGPVEKFLAAAFEYFGNMTAAGMFIFVMGFLFVCCSTKKQGECFRQALMLFALGIFVNIFEQCILLWVREGIWQNSSVCVPQLFATDIYFFAALAMVYLGLLLRCEERKRPYVVLVTLAACVIVSAVVGTDFITTGSVWADTFLGMFIKTNEWSFFPFFNWLPFTLFGYLVGHCYKKGFSEMRGAIILFLVGLVAAYLADVIMDVYGISNAISFGSSFTAGDYYGLNGMNHLCGLGTVSVWFAIYYFVCRLTKGKIPAFLRFLSENIIDIYVWQWMVISVAESLLKSIDNIYVNLLIGVGILAVSAFMVKWNVWKPSKTFRKIFAM